jgi:hypothetical protein
MKSPAGESRRGFLLLLEKWNLRSRRCDRRFLVIPDLIRDPSA